MRQVRSCTLDTWLPEQVLFMETTGNEVANAYWEAKLQSADRPSQDPLDLERFIRRKVQPIVQDAKPGTQRQKHIPRGVNMCLSRLLVRSPLHCGVKHAQVAVHLATHLVCSQRSAQHDGQSQELSG